MAFYTFENRRLTFNEATRYHTIVGDVLKASKKIRNKQDRINFINTYDEIWSALVRVIKPENKGLLANGIDWTIPKHYIPIMHLGNCIAAAFAFGCIYDQFIKQNVDTTDDLVVRKALRKAWEDFETRRLLSNYVEEGFGCDQSTSWHTLRDIVGINQGYSIEKQMEEIAKLAGRMFDSFKYQKKSVESDDPQSVKKTTIGGDIERLTPSEMVKLGTDQTKDITSMKILNKEAQQIDMKGLRKTTRGPLVLAIDESASMHDMRYGARGRNCWAKACAVALTRIAWNENRPVRAVHFGSSAIPQEVPKDDYGAMFEMARSFMSGGTSFQRALDVSIKQVGDLEANGYKGADILLITDGEDHDYDAHNILIDKMDADDIKLWTISIAGDIDPKSPVRFRAEKYTCVNADRLDDSSNLNSTIKALGEFKNAGMANSEEN